MASSLQFHCIINNRCDVPLKVKETYHRSGRWYPEEVSQPKDVPAKQVIKAFASSGRIASSSGTEGYVIYQLGNEPNAWIKIYWDVPWLTNSNNKFKIETSHENIIVQTDGFIGTGSVENILLKVIDLRD
ncbi:hypothetical protein ACX27_25480 [Nostoc piscinale CENA21]|uniref:Aegerolysin n=1 Tax=Nostoc piscinale CENA21 TaxID=224013 RepID=A0A0M4T7L5_9NOSO|nr:aegerolysin family protein [Nostoc piscinale]ALF55416.1 hypothetical protein ACX27_25480 [Nostoc piscinale CENA21]